MAYLIAQCQDKMVFSSQKKSFQKKELNKYLSFQGILRDTTKLPWMKHK